MQKHYILTMPKKTKNTIELSSQLQLLLFKNLYILDIEHFFFGGYSWIYTTFKQAETNEKVKG